jgi:uncharacterized protein YcnI
MKLLRVSVAVAIAAAAVLLAPASPAAAHVTISPATATAGGRGTFTFKVPNERADASTTRLEVLFPENAVLASVSLKPVPGWTATVATRELPATSAGATHGEERGGRAVTGIVWQGGAIKPSEFQTFEVSMGPLPKEPTKLIFKALQTYSSGEVVRWIEVAPEGGARPEHPAPVISVEAPAVVQEAAPVAPTDGTARWLAFGGLLIGLLGLAVALIAVRRVRPAGTSPGAVAKQPSIMDDDPTPKPVVAASNGSVRP